MGTRIYPFIDIAVLDQVRPHFLAGDAVVILSVELDAVIWANGAGAALIGYGDIEEVRGAPSNLGFAARRQISALPGFPTIGANRSLLVRVTQRLSSHAIGFLASEIIMPDGMLAIMLVAPDFEAGKRSPHEAAARAIYGIAEAGHHAALVDGEGRPLSSSAGFDALGIPEATLRELAEDAAQEPARLIKRLVPIADHAYPMGTARLSDDPARHLVIVVDDPQPLQAVLRTAPQQLPADEPTATLPPVRGNGVRPIPLQTAFPAGSDTDNWFFDDAVPPKPAAEAPAPLPRPDLPSSPPISAPLTVEEVPHDGSRVAIEEEPVHASRPGEPGPGPLFLEERAADEHVSHTQPQGELADPAPLPEDVAPAPAAEDEMARDFPEPLEEAAEAEAPTSMLDEEDAGGVEDEAVFRPDLRAGPVRFVWRTDAAGHFSAVSEEFAASVGARAADVIGKPFREVAAKFGLDPDGEITGLLERRDTWSGRTVMWPIENTDLKVPVDLAALPVYGRDRAFDGFRGFGVVRIGDAVIDEAALGLTLGGVPEHSCHPVAPANDDRQPGNDPFAGETPALAVKETPERRRADKVIRLAEHRQGTERGLSPHETSAFREIGARLKDAEGTPPVPEEPVADALPGHDDHADEPVDPAQFSATPSLEEIEARLRSADQLIRGIVDDSDESPSGADLDAGEPEAESSADADGIEPDHLVEDEIADEELPPEEFLENVPAETGADLPDEGDLAAPSEEVVGEAERDDTLLYPPEPGPESRSVDTSILERLPVPVLIHTGDALHFANEEFFRLTGYVSLRELVDAGGLDVLFVDADESAAPPADPRRRLRTRDGDEFPVDALLQSVPWKGGKALLLALKTTPPAPAPAATLEDLRELESRVAEMSTILDTATDGIVIIGNDGAIRSISRPAEALFGYDTAEVAGKPFISLFAVESQRAARDYLSGLSDNGVASVLNDGREVIGREAQGRFIPLFMTIGKLPGAQGYCAVLRDITPWKRAEEELTQARAEAERASSQKTEFLARISHEIRTPLNAIIGFSELMMDEKFGPIMNDRYRDYLRDINRSGNHVLDLVNDLLDISKIEAGEQELAYEAVSLNETLAETVAMMQPQANRNRVIIRSSYASRLPDVVADVRSIRQIALNLLSNAVRYTQAGGQVIVSTAYEPTGDVVLRVRDTGIGMTQGEIEQALKPFRQINALKRPRGDGTGLGLPLTKAMVEANRARFSISSAPGDGTLVEIVFPSQRVLAG